MVREKTINSDFGMGPPKPDIVSIEFGPFKMTEKNIKIHGFFVHKFLSSPYFGVAWFGLIIQRTYTKWRMK